MVSCDLVGIRPGILEKVREKVAEFDVGKLQHSSRTLRAWEKPS